MCPAPRVAANFSPVKNLRRQITAWTAAAALQALSLVALGLTPAQDRLPAVKLTIGRALVNAEIADEDAERAKGLMGRNELAEGEGMLFVFASPQPMNFWMHDTVIPLSIAYINAQGVIREIHDLKPMDETPVQSAVNDLMFALEVPQGWFERNSILPGDRILGLPSPNTATGD
ncbi:MAG: DUF192 domain-containing protein [Chthoniobacterales bacterium]|nr:DUF192 domain-containing protein [Chthoniobacterales bacterium]